MISKELLSEVLEVQSEYDGLVKDGTELVYKVKTMGILRKINVYELAHKCKEWALNNGYRIFIYSDDNSEWYCQVQLVDVDEQPKEWSVADTEPEAIFKACQWILDNKEPV